MEAFQVKVTKWIPVNTRFYSLDVYVVCLWCRWPNIGLTSSAGCIWTAATTYWDGSLTSHVSHIHIRQAYIPRTWRQKDTRLLIMCQCVWGAGGAGCRVQGLICSDGTCGHSSADLGNQTVTCQSQCFFNHMAILRCTECGQNNRNAW